MSESICSIGSWSRRLGPSDFTGYGASAIRTDGSPSRGLRPACGGLFPCRGDKRLGRDHPRNSAPAEPDTVDLLAREQSHHARASPRVTGHAAVAFVPPGAQGIAMSTWLSGVGATPVPLVGDARRGLANGGSARFGQGRANCRGWPDRATPRDCARRAVACPGDGRGDQAGWLLGIARA